MRFEGRNVLVTGGASGIGLAIADAFLTEGARVLVADRDRAGLDRLPERLADPGRLETIAIDIAEPGAAGAPRRARRGDPGRGRRARQQRRVDGPDADPRDRRGGVGSAVLGQPAGDLLPDPGRRPPDGRAPRRRGGLDLLGQRPADRVAGGPLQRDQGGHRRDHALVRQRAQSPRVAVQLRRAGRDGQRRGGRRLHRRGSRPDPRVPAAGAAAPRLAALRAGAGGAVPRLRRCLLRQRRDDRRRRRRAERRLVRHRPPAARPRAPRGPRGPRSTNHAGSGHAFAPAADRRARGRRSCARWRR